MVNVGLLVEVLDKELQKSLIGITGALSPEGMSAFMSVVMVPYLKDRAKERFEDEGDDVSGKWEPLKPATQAIRAGNPDWNVGPDHPINVRTHELENYIIGSNALVRPNDLGAQMQYPARPSTKRTIRDKMKTAQTGSSNPRTVARPVLGMNEADMIYMQLALVKHILMGESVAI